MRQGFVAAALAWLAVNGAVAQGAPLTTWRTQLDTNKVLTLEYESAAWMEVPSQETGSTLFVVAPHDFAGPLKFCRVASNRLPPPGDRASQADLNAAATKFDEAQFKMLPLGATSELISLTHPAIDDVLSTAIIADDSVGRTPNVRLLLSLFWVAGPSGAQQIEVECAHVPQADDPSWRAMQAIVASVHVATAPKP